MEKKQLFNSSLVGFHPNTFIPFLELDINIDDYNIYEDFTIEKDITLNDNFIDIYNKIEKGDFCSISLNITNNNSDNSTIILSGYRGTTGLYFRDIVILQTSNRTTITNLNFTNIDISSKTASIVFIRKIISQSDSDNIIVHLTTTINGLTNLNPGDFNETVTLTVEEYNTLNEIPVGEIFLLNNGNVTFLTFKVGPKVFRASRDYIDGNLANRSLISFLIDLGENNQATFKGNVTKLMNPNNYLAKNNTTAYTPTGDYNPATKKYVDDSIPELATTLTSGLMSKEDKAKLDGKNSNKDINIDSIINKIKAEPQGTDVDITLEFNSLFGSWSEFKLKVRHYNYINQPYTINGDSSGDRYTWTTIYSNFNEGYETYTLYKYLVWLDGDSIMGRVTILQLSKTSGENNALYGDGNYKRTLSCTNTDEYTPTSNYHPATKKYVDDLVSWSADLMPAIRDFDLTDDTYTINVTFNAIDRTDYVFLTQIATMNINNTNVSFDVIIYKYNNSPSLNDRYIIVAPDQIKVNNSIYNIKYIKNNTTKIGIQFTKIQQILTESEYAALGTTPETDNVLYFVTPD